MASALANVREALSILGESEEDLNAIYAIAYQFYNAGHLTEETRSEVHRLRDGVHVLERAMYAMLTASVSLVFQPWVVAPAIASMIPEPVRRPDLPPANPGRPPARPLSVPIQGAVYTTTIGGQTRTGIWVVAGIAVVALAIGATIVGVVFTQELFAFLREGRRLTAETRRYLGSLRDAFMRFQSCTSSGRGIEECMEIAPAPKPPAANVSSTFPWGLAAIATVVAGAGWYMYSSKAGQYVRNRLTEES